MSLRIFVHASSATAFPTGGRIQGHVELDLKFASQKETIKVVNLSFSCCSNIRISRRESTSTGTGITTATRHYPSKAVLFWKTSSLANPAFQAPASRRGEDGGTLSWEFQVPIPSYPEPLHPEVINELDGDTFQMAGPFPASFGYDPAMQCLPLPDAMMTFSCTAGPSTSISGSTRYVLHAEVPGLSSGFKSLWIGNKDTEVDVPVLNQGLNLNAAPIRWNKLAYEETIRTLRLLPSHTDAKLSFREKTRNIFQKSSLPSMDFRLSFTAPDILLLDRPTEPPMPFSLNIQRCSAPVPIEDAKVPFEEAHTPNIYLRKCLSASLHIQRSGPLNIGSGGNLEGTPEGVRWLASSATSQRQRIRR